MDWVENSFLENFWNENCNLFEDKKDGKQLKNWNISEFKIKFGTQIQRTENQNKLNK